LTWVRIALQRSRHGDIEAVVRRPVNVVSRRHDLTFPTAFGMKPPIWPPTTAPPERPPEIGAEQWQLSSSMAGLKPFTAGIRSMPPFGLPKREGQHEQASSRNTGGVASSQVDPPQGGTGAHGQQHGRGRDRSPLQLPERLDGPAPLAFVPPPTAPREVRLNGFPGALAEVSRQQLRRRRVPGPGRGAHGDFGRD